MTDLLVGLSVEAVSISVGYTIATLIYRALTVSQKEKDKQCASFSQEH